MAFLPDEQSLCNHHTVKAANRPEPFAYHAGLKEKKPNRTKLLAGVYFTQPG
jgi:hypothetical protein